MTCDKQLAVNGGDTDSEASGVAATLLAAGVGCLAMGVVTTLSEARKPIADLLNFYKPVGPLSGKSLTAVVIWLVVWAALSRAVRGRQIHVGRWLTLALVCVGLGLVATFPPFFDLFSGN